MIKKIFGALIAVVMLVAVSYVLLVAHNNRTVAPPPPEALRASREKATAWLLNNREEMLADQNTILWWMIDQGAQRSGDIQLQSLVAEYKRRLAEQQPQSVWGAFFDPSRVWGTQFPPELYRGNADYQQFFLFSLSCSKQFIDEPVIVAQTDTGFCRRIHPYSPACVTHQLMGYRFMQRSQCFRVPEIERKVAVLQESIVDQLTWDPRVVDVYIQRVLMLTESGAAARVKPRWVQRVLDAQLADGSWSSLQPLVPVGGGRYFGFVARFAGVEPHVGNLHATAQGIWLMSLLESASSGRAVALGADEQGRGR